VFVFKNLIPISQRTYFVSVTNNGILIMFRERITFYNENRSIAQENAVAES